MQDSGVRVKSKSISMSSFPNPFLGNPYLSLLYGALGRQGVSYVRSGYFGQEWLREHRGKVDVLHFHWLDTYYGDGRNGVSLVRLAAFVLKILMARSLGYKVIWTMHNQYPHNRKRDWKAWLARFLCIHSVNVVCVTFPGAGADVARLFHRRRGVILLPHGNYDPVYPDIPSKAQARQELGLAQDDFVFFLFGGISPYKGAHAAITAFSRVASAGNTRLVVMGQCLNADYAERLQRLAADLPGVRLCLGGDDVPDEVVCTWMSAVDCILAPYDEIYTSGMLYLAATFGKPIIAPRQGVFSTLGDREFVFLYDKAHREEQLPERMAQVLSADPRAVSESARRFAAEHDWDRIAADVLRDLEACL